MKLLPSLLFLAVTIRLAQHGAFAQDFAYAGEMAIAKDEIALEGRIVGVDGIKNEIQLDAMAFVAASGRKQTFATSKPKTLRLLPGTKLLDERTGKTATLGDLRIGLMVHAIGHDGGGGKPLDVRVLNWSSPEPPDVDVPPALVPLLPPSKTWKGVDFRVVEAGFKPRKEILPQFTLKSTAPEWMIAVRSTPRNSARLLELQYPAEFGSGIQGSGEWSLPSGQKGQVYQFSGIDPRWKSVRARFELTAPNASPDAKGEINARVPVEIPVPDAPNGVLEPHLKISAPHGVQIELMRVEANDAQKHLKLEWKWTPPADAPTAQVYFNLGSLKSGDTTLSNVRQSVGGNDGSRRTITEEIYALPRGAKLSSELLFRASSHSWREKDALQVFDVDLPVAKLAAALPPTRVQRSSEPVVVQNDVATAQWEGSPRPENNPLLWLSPRPVADAKPNSLPQRLVLQEVVFSAPGQQDFKKSFYSTRGNVFWHDNNQIVGDTETGWSVPLPDWRRSVESARLTASAQLVEVFEGEHRFTGIPLPAPGTIKEYADDEWSDDAVSVRKVAWIKQGTPQYQALRAGGLESYVGEGGALVIVCEVTHAWADGRFSIAGTNFSADGSPLKAGLNWRSEDVLSKNNPVTGALSFFVELPSPEDKTLDINFYSCELSPGKAQKFVFEGLPLAKDQ